MSEEINIPAALQQIALLAGLNHDCKLLTGDQVAAGVLQRDGGEHGQAVVIRQEDRGQAAAPASPRPRFRHHTPETGGQFINIPFFTIRPYHLRPLIGKESKMDDHDTALLCKMLLLALSLIAFCYQIMALVFQPL